MNRSNWKNLFFVFVIVVLMLVLLRSGWPTAAEAQPSASLLRPGASSQSADVPPAVALDVSQEDHPLFSDTATPPPLSSASTPGGSSQGSGQPAPVAPGESLDNRELFPNAASRFYHIPGSVLMPVDSTTTLTYDYMGCIHANTGGDDLLNAPLDIPEGSTLVGMRLYYYDTNAGINISAWITRYNAAGTDYDDILLVTSSGSAGHGNSWAEADPTMSVVDTYDWSYVLNGRLNGAENTLQICGLRVMYTPPPGCCTYLPSVMRDLQP